MMSAYADLLQDKDKLGSTRPESDHGPGVRRWWALRDCITNLRVGNGPLAPRGREVQASFGGLDLTVVSTTFEMWMGP